MIILKCIILAIAIFTSLLFISNLISDAVGVFSWCNTIHTEEEVKNKDKVSLSNAKYRLILSIIISISWAIVAVI